VPLMENNCKAYLKIYVDRIAHTDSGT